MADISDINSAQSVKIIGADSAGVEQTPVNSFNQQLQSADLLNGTAVQGTLSVGTGAAVECKVGASNLANRKLLILAAAGSNLTYGFASGSQPFAFANGATISYALGPNISIWVRRASGIGNVDVDIAEIS